MNLSSQISVPKDFQIEFGEADKSQKIRYFVLSIKDWKTKSPKLELLHKENATTDLEKDFNSMVNFVQKKEDGKYQPAFFLFRNDPIKHEKEEKEEEKEEVEEEQDKGLWTNILFVPQDAKVKQKMLYSSSSSTIKQQIGNNYFIAQNYFASSEDDLEYKSYLKSTVQDEKKYFECMTESEKQFLQEHMDSNQDIGDTGSKNFSGMKIPSTEDVKKALEDIKGDNDVNFVSIKVKKEKFVLDKSEDGIKIDDLKDYVPNNEPRFIFFRYKHDFNESECDKLLFIYFCPMLSKVKLRTIYSTSKGPIIKLYEGMNVKIDKAMEFSELKDFNEKDVFNYLHPKKDTGIKMYSKPKGPGRKKRKKKSKNVEI